MAAILLIFLRIKLTRVYDCHFLYMYFPDRGVHTPYSPCMYTPLFSKNHSQTVGTSLTQTLSVACRRSY